MAYLEIIRLNDIAFLYPQLFIHQFLSFQVLTVIFIDCGKQWKAVADFIKQATFNCQLEEKLKMLSFLADISARNIGRFVFLFILLQGRLILVRYKEVINAG